MIQIPKPNVHKTTFIHNSSLKTPRKEKDGKERIKASSLNSTVELNVTYTNPSTLYPQTLMYLRT